jgi:hypothetical protein
MLEEMSSAVRGSKDLREQLEVGDAANADPRFFMTLKDFIRKFGDLSCPVTGVVTCTQGPEALIRLVREMASQQHRRAQFQYSSRSNRRSLDDMNLCPIGGKGFANGPRSLYAGCQEFVNQRPCMVRGHGQEQPA